MNKLIIYKWLSESPSESSRATTSTPLFWVANNLKAFVSFVHRCKQRSISYFLLFGSKQFPPLSNPRALILLLPQLASMGIDAGFDMVPRLSKGAVDRENWQSFIKAIKERYQNDDLVEIKPNYLEFKAGEHPLLPLEGHKFLRFSSKISGSHAKGVEKYIDTVTRVAQLSFGSRVRYWNQAGNEWGFYNWEEVLASIESYEQVRDGILNMTVEGF